jgi:hypothetical protein
MNWNNRVINEDGTLVFAEVTYIDGKPVGYTTPCLVGDDIEELRGVLEMLTAALDKPVLTMDSFNEGVNHD